MSEFTFAAVVYSINFPACGFVLVGPNNSNNNWSAI